MGMPLRVRDRMCAVLTPYDMGQGGDNCERPTTTRAVWRFETPGPLRILLRDEHAAELADEEWLTLMS